VREDEIKLKQKNKKRKIHKKSKKKKVWAQTFKITMHTLALFSNKRYNFYFQ